MWVPGLRYARNEFIVAWFDCISLVFSTNINLILDSVNLSQDCLILFHLRWGKLWAAKVWQSRQLCLWSVILSPSPLHPINSLCWFLFHVWQASTLWGQGTFLALVQLEQYWLWPLRSTCMTLDQKHYAGASPFFKKGFGSSSCRVCGFIPNSHLCFKPPGKNMNR